MGKIKRILPYASTRQRFRIRHLYVKNFRDELGIEEHFSNFGTTMEGTDTGPILHLFRKRGLSVSVKRDATLRNIYEAINNDWPILISVDDGDHWVVIYGYSEDGIYILDPALKSILCEWSVVEFGGRWDEAWIAVVKKLS